MKMRKVHIDDKEWKYLIIGSMIVIRTPDNKKHVTDMTEAFNMTNDEVEKGLYKGWLHIGPGDIKKYIQENLL